jgi:hypothetical protein
MKKKKKKKTTNMMMITIIITMKVNFITCHEGPDGEYRGIALLFL